MTEILGACPIISEPAERINSVTPAHPHFGGKQPKQNRPPPKCISVICREEKGQLTEELEETKKDLADALEELSKYLHCSLLFNIPVINYDLAVKLSCSRLSYKLFKHFNLHC